MRGIFARAAVATIALAVARPAHAEDQTLTLSRALEIGRQKAPGLKNARAHAESAEANIDEQRANYYPTLNATLQGGSTAIRDTQPAPPGSTPDSSGLFAFVNYSAVASAGTSVRWTLYDFGRTGGSVAAAEANHASSVANVSETEIGVMNDVANAYVTLHYKEELREVTKATLLQREKLVVIAKGLIKAGLQPPLEEIRAQARAEQARLQLATAEADAYDARAVLASLLAIDPTVAMHIAPPRLPRLDLEPATAMRESEKLPQVVGANADHQAREATVDAAFSRYFPQIQLAIDDAYRFTRYDKSDVLLNTRNVTATLLVQIPIFDASIGPNLTGARADAASSGYIADQAKRDVRNEAARAAFGVRTAAVALDHAKKAADGAGAVLQIVQARYIQGLSSPLELIDAEGSDSDARIAKAQSELAYALAVVRIFTATGRKIVEDSP